jgi:mRNA interferase MazF
MEVNRGDLVTVALPGDCGKPRPALVVQADAFSDLLSVTMLQLTSDIRNSPLFLITVEPGRENGLRRRSQIMVDKAVTAPRARLGQRIGRVDGVTMRAVDDALIRFLGLD